MKTKNLLILLAIFTIIWGGLGYWAIQHKSIVGTPSDWKTYTNESFGYQINYPESYSIDTTGSAPGEVRFLKSNSSEAIPVIKAISASKPTHEGCEKEGRYTEDGVDVEYHQVLLDGATGCSFTTSEFGYNEATFWHNGYSYTIVAYGELYGDGLISTFKFTSPQTSTTSISDWKTYSNDYSFPFTIKIPKDWTVEVGDESPVWTFENSDSSAYIQAWPAECLRDVYVCKDGFMFSSTNVDKNLFDEVVASFQDWKTINVENFTIKVPVDWTKNLDVDGVELQSTSTIADNGLPPVGELWVVPEKIDSCDNSSNAFVPVFNPKIIEKNFCKDGYHVMLGLWQADPKLEEHEQLLDQILSTFKLVK